MAEALLLTGAPGCGKTTLIRRVVEALPCPAGGFYTREVREGGARVGFEVVTLDGARATLARIGLKSAYRVARYGVDLAGLEAVAVPSIRRAMEAASLVVIDEIGPMESFSEAFRAAVLAALTGPVPVLGTIVKRRTPFADYVKAQPGVTLIEVHAGNRDALVHDLSRTLQARIGGTA